MYLNMFDGGGTDMFFLLPNMFIYSRAILFFFSSSFTLYLKVANREFTCETILEHLQYSMDFLELKLKKN